MEITERRISEEMKAFHKASSIIPFSPVPPAGKGWEYSYPQLLHSPQEQLGALLCPGTCHPKPRSTWLCKQPGLEQLRDVPRLTLRPHFLMHSSQGETGIGVIVSPCLILAGMLRILRPRNGSVLEDSIAPVLSLLPKGRC